MSATLTAIFTAILSVATLKLYRAGEQQILVARIAANAAKDSAEAAVNASRPFLFPRLIRLGQLHPDEVAIDDSGQYEAKATFVFENHGETPGIIREVRAKLDLLHRDKLPPLPSVAELPNKTEYAIVPGHTHGEAAVVAAGSAIECKLMVSASDVRGAIMEAKRDLEFRRFYLFGQVVYDDFFGTRSTQRFCIKMRKSGFQVIKGGDAHNSIRREKVPAADSLESGELQAP